MKRLILPAISMTAALLASPVRADSPAELLHWSRLLPIRPAPADEMPSDDTYVVEGLPLEITSKFDERIVLRDPATAQTLKARSPFGEADMYPRFYDPDARRLYGTGPGGVGDSGMNRGLARHVRLAGGRQRHAATENSSSKGSFPAPPRRTTARC